MSDSEMKQDAAILNLLKNFAAETDQDKFVDGIEECREGSLEESVLPSKKCHVDANGYISTEDKESEK